MVIRRFLFSWVCLLASSLFMYGQVAVKTNVAIDAVAIPNLGVEVGLSKKLTVDIPFYYNPWKYSDNKMLKLVMVQPELRYWLCDKFNGHFFGFHLMGGAYNTTGIDLPFSPFDDLKDFRYKGHFYGGGVSSVISLCWDAIGIWAPPSVWVMLMCVIRNMSVKNVEICWRNPTRIIGVLLRLL